MTWLEYFKNCDEEEGASLPELVYEHCIHWHERKTPQMNRGIYGCESMLTWMKCALAYSELAQSRDEPGLTLEAFTGLKLPPFLIYTQFGYEYISRMSLLETVRTLEAVEWCVFSDMFRTYSDPWWNQAFHLFTLLLQRCFFLSVGEDFSVDVLNVTEYVNSEIVDIRKHYLNKLRDESVQENGDSSTVVSGDGYAESTVTDPNPSGRKAYQSDPEDQDGASSDEEAASKKKKKRIVPNVQPLPKTEKESVTGYDAQRKNENKFVKTIVSTSLKWLFDIDSTTTPFLLYAFHHEHETPPEPIPSHNLERFRIWLFAETRKESESEVVTFRRKWYEDLIVMESYKRIFCRRNPMDPRPASRAIIINKHEELHHQHCKSLDEVCDMYAENELLRMNTDAMVFMKSRSLGSTPGGDFVQAVYRKSFMDVKGEELCIYRDPIRNGWILYFSPDRRFIARSFTAALVYMRLRMRMLQMGNSKGEYDVSVWDTHFFR